MIFAQKIEDFDNKKIYFCDPIKNSLLSDGGFTRIVYSDNCSAFNGIAFKMTVQDAIFERYYNKLRINFSTANNASIVNKIYQVEEEILGMIEFANKSPVFNMREQMRQYSFQHLRQQNLHKSHLVLKISGIWESDCEYGLTYKFLKCCDTPPLAISCVVYQDGCKS